jgi:hypothetical protein
MNCVRKKEQFRRYFPVERRNVLVEETKKE